MRRRAQRQKGAALLMVLWVSVIVALLLVGVQMNIRNLTQTTRTELSLLKAHAALDGAATYAAYRMARSRRNEQVLPLEVQLGEYTVAVQVSPEMQKLDVNLASPSDLTRFWQSRGVEAEAAEALTEGLVESREGVVTLETVTSLPNLTADIVGSPSAWFTTMGGRRPETDQQRIRPQEIITLRATLSNMTNGQTPPGLVLDRRFRGTGDLTRPVEALD